MHTFLSNADAKLRRLFKQRKKNDRYLQKTAFLLTFVNRHLPP